MQLCEDNALTLIPKLEVIFLSVLQTWKSPIGRRGKGVPGNSLLLMSRQWQWLIAVVTGGKDGILELTNMIILV